MTSPAGGSAEGGSDRSGAPAGANRREVLAASGGLVSAPAQAKPGVALARQPVRRGYCDGPFGQIHYRECGSGPPIILCHGAGWTSHEYAYVLPLLGAAGLHAVAFDTPGAGLSDAAPGEPSIEALSWAIDAVQLHLRAARVAVGGHHTGGNMASAFAARRPRATRALVISGPEAGFHYTAYVETLPPPAALDGSHVMALWRGFAKYRNPAMNAEDVTRNLGYELIARKTTWQLSFATGRFDASSTYERVRSPTLVLCGVADGLDRYMETTRRLRPDFRRQELPGVGLDEAPQAWADAVLAFLRANG